MQRIVNKTSHRSFSFNKVSFLCFKFPAFTSITFLAILFLTAISLFSLFNATNTFAATCSTNGVTGCGSASSKGNGAFCEAWIGYSSSYGNGYCITQGSVTGPYVDVYKVVNNAWQHQYTQFGSYNNQCGWNGNCPIACTCASGAACSNNSDTSGYHYGNANWCEAYANMCVNGVPSWNVYKCVNNVWQYQGYQDTPTYQNRCYVNPNSCPAPTATPTPSPTPTPTPTPSYNCNNGGPNAGPCNAWWIHEKGGSGMGLLGGIGTSVNMSNIYGGNGIIDDFIFLIDHGNNTPGCRSGSSSVWIRLGLQNDGGSNHNVHFEYDICPPDAYAVAHVGETIPTTDYGQYANLSIYQDGPGGGLWWVNYSDGHNISQLISIDMGSPITPYAWRIGETMTGTSGASTPYVNFINNSYCPWNSDPYGSSCSFTYDSNNDISIDDETSNDSPWSNYPLGADWVTPPSPGNNGGNLETYINYNPTTPTPTLTPTPTPSCAQLYSGGTCVSSGICSSNGGVNHGTLGCVNSNVCCTFPPPTATPTPTPVPSCTGSGGTCTTNSICQANCNLSHQNACMQLDCGSGKVCCY